MVDVLLKYEVAIVLTMPTDLHVSLGLCGLLVVLYHTVFFFGHLLCVYFLFRNGSYYVRIFQ